MGTPTPRAHEENSTIRYATRKRRRPSHGSPGKRSQELGFDATEEGGEATLSGVTTRAMHKRLRSAMPVNPFDGLCDDLILSILACLSSRARAPSHLIAAALTCKRFHMLVMQKRVLAHASKHAVAVRASAWCKEADSFVRLCADASNLEACFTLGMIKFYCMGKKGEGVELLAKAAKAWHAGALYALAIIHFNGSGGKASDKNTRAGVALCVRAALTGSVEAMREIGHCFKEGQGLPRDAVAGRRLLLEANRKEAASFLDSPCRSESAGSVQAGRKVSAQYCAHRAHRVAMYKELLCRSLLSDYGCAFPLRWILQKAHPAHLFMVEWFATHAPSGWGFLRMCSHALCGRAETRPLEFRQCSVCSSAFYCSRACQSMDWKLRHMVVCHPSLPSLA